jgi:serine/threonine protein kinase/Tfp pilus assembly protein PilF
VAVRISDPAAWEKAKNVIADALRRPASERSAFVREQCPNDPDLGAEIDSIIKGYEDDTRFLERSPVAEENQIDELADLKPGTFVGPYIIVDRLGRGGMGQVFLGSDPRLHRKVALKCLVPSRLESEERRHRIILEARAAAGINHPNVATIHDVIEHEGRAFIVMEYVEGENLAARLKRERLTIDLAVSIGRQLASALAAAHASGVVHRDLKPGNVQVLSDNSVKVLDFGVAKEMAVGSAWSTTLPRTPPGYGEPHGVVGTPGYMSPEQLLGREVDDRSDIFSLGIVLHEMTTGRRLFTKSDPLDQMVTMAKRPPRVDAGDSGVPSQLADVIDKALQIDPADRFQLATEMAAALGDVQAHLATNRASTTVHDTGAVTASGHDEAATSARRRRWLVAALVAGVVVLVAIFLNRWSEPQVFAARSRVLVADFDNSTGDVDLDQAIREGLTIQLQQSPYVNVLARAQVFDALRRMQRSNLATLDEATAAELSIRENVAVLITGTVFRSGGALWITARGVSPTTRNLLFAERQRFERQDQVPSQIDGLARRIRQRLGESISGIDQNSQPLASVTTSSVEALKLYSRAADLYARGSLEGAPALLQQALELDPKFAMAHRLLASVYGTLGNPASAREHDEKAYQLRASLSERERRRVEAAYFLDRGEDEKAVNVLIALTSLYPDDAEAHLELGDLLSDLGNLEKAADELETAISLNPFASNTYARLVLMATQLSQYDRAADVYRRAAQRNFQSPQLAWGRAMILLGGGKPDEARAALAELVRSEVYSGTGRLYLATTDMYEGKLGDAVSELENGIRFDQRLRNTQPERKRRYFLSRIALLRGDARAARSQVDVILTAPLETLEPQELMSTGMMLARMGDVQQARRLLRQLEQVKERVGSPYHKSRYSNLAGEIALAEKDDKRAEESFLSALSEYPRVVSTVGLARAYEARGDWPRARAEWEKVMQSRGEIFYEGFAADWVLAHLQAARSSQKSSDLSAARRYYDEFLRIWEHADDLAPRRQAISERDALPR